MESTFFIFENLINMISFFGFVYIAIAISHANLI